jgi:hypothetical protein
VTAEIDSQLAELPKLLVNIVKPSYVWNELKPKGAFDEYGGFSPLSR